MDAIILSDGVKKTGIGGIVEVSRLDYNSKKLKNYKIKIPKKITDIDNFILEDGDFINVRKNPTQSNINKVFVSGDVLYPGEYIINKGSTNLSDIIDRFGGFLSTANLNGLIILRKNSDFTISKDSSEYQIKKDLSKFIKDSRFTNSVSTLLSKQINKSFNLIENDKILNKKDIDELDKNDDDQKITIKRDSLSLETTKNVKVGDKDLFFREIKISYNDIVKSKLDSTKDLLLLDGDIIYVPSSNMTVTINGEVYRPTNVVFDKRKSFKNYIDNAGGIKNNARINNSYIVYSDGNVKKVKSFLFFKFFPPVKKDSEIVVPSIDESKSKFNINDVFAIISSSVSTYLLFKAVTDN